MIGEFLEKYTFDYLMKEALSRVNENIDTREGSIIYDALAPACYELAGFYLDLKNLLLDTFRLKKLSDTLLSQTRNTKACLWQLGQGLQQLMIRL